MPLSCLCLWPPFVLPACGPRRATVVLVGYTAHTLLLQRYYERPTAAELWMMAFACVAIIAIVGCVGCFTGASAASARTH